MGSVLLSKKAFLYFGGLAVILIGGFVVIASPYHYINYSLSENTSRPWVQYEQSGYYPRVEISITLRPSNLTEVFLDLVIQNNDTLEMTFVNMTLGPEHALQIIDSDSPIVPDSLIYEYSENIDLPIGNYTVYFDNIEGAGLVDLGLNQFSDSRLWIVTGGMMNIIGVIMGIVGYLVPGSILPSDSDTIVDWGYEDEESDKYSN